MNFRNISKTHLTVTAAIAIAASTAGLIDAGASSAQTGATPRAAATSSAVPAAATTSAAAPSFVLSASAAASSSQASRRTPVPTAVATPAPTAVPTAVPTPVATAVPTSAPTAKPATPTVKPVAPVVASAPVRRAAAGQPVGRAAAVPNAPRVTPAPTPVPTPVPAPVVTVSSIAQAILNQLNVDRAQNGLAPLRMNAKLVASAHAHNLAMDAANTMSHQLPGEAPLQGRLAAVGYGWSAAGENVGWNSVATTAGALDLDRQMMAEVAPNDGHRQNILSTRFGEVGVDIIIDPSTGRLWLAEDFGQPN